MQRRIRRTNRITSPNFAYDVSGNQTITPAQNPSGQQRYQYDAANRLVRVTDGSGNPVANYTYGATNQRLITEQGNERTYYVAAGGSVLAEYTEATSSTTPAWSQSYIYLGGRLLATLEPSGGTERVEYHHPDRLGTRLSTNQSDQTTQEQATLPFGTALEFETSGTSTTRRFTSYDRSTATGLDYAVNRSYDSLQGRFTQVDPAAMSAVSLDNPQTLNLYAYCANDPVNCLDPDGLGIISFFKKLGKAIWKVLTSKVFLIAASIALAVISFGASAGWWALSSAVTQSVSLGSGITLSATTTQATALGWIAAGVSTALAIPALTSVSGILQRVASFGFGQALGGLGGAVGMGGTPDWNDDADEFAQRRGGGRRPPPRRGQRGYRGPGSWAYGTRYWRRAPRRYWAGSTQFQGNTVYQRNDLIDPMRRDARGRTSLELMEQGLAPIGPDGLPINLHHVLQTQNGPLVELSTTLHRRYSRILHINPNTVPSGINRARFDTWKRSYWMNRARDFR